MSESLHHVRNFNNACVSDNNICTNVLNTNAISNFNSTIVSANNFLVTFTNMLNAIATSGATNRSTGEILSEHFTVIHIVAENISKMMGKIRAYKLPLSKNFKKNGIN